MKRKIHILDARKESLSNSMKYLVVLTLLLTGCATPRYIELNDVEGMVAPDDLGYSDLEHRVRAKELGISYVDYLHLLNNNKKRVNRSYFKYDHND